MSLQFNDDFVWVLRFRIWEFCNSGSGVGLHSMADPSRPPRLWRPNGRVQARPVSDHQHAKVTNEECHIRFILPGWGTKRLTLSTS